ncbi:MAG: hypothetical protein A2940_00425 [Candidatus Wildermuthbacteria bacterium RIFCSPLOWO2_01_FULL_48_29]|uniref:Prepilin-type N-terminal cleavage/methylation domain-containing protein n=1 Tax=Candidatus Wildermuthbacteria bacterium RIFCSPLOWO2_01_FULL_48_29 TaxID=1802462 RepID=A0A1G2RMN6_9BACT|nr:MAG: hypothetical protein A2940_00425 [Candidatus Wildermuthbacteria bacterium RIFCSPLOWO2_01_FULL_48_29]
MNNQRAFTLIEMLVALAVFGIIIGITSGYLVSAISVQRETLAIRPMVDETSFVAEYMSRALRPAQRSQDASCLSASGLYYEVSPTGDSVTFIDEDERCREMYFEAGAGKIRETIDGVDGALTSSSLDIQNMEFVLPASAERHPQVTFSMEVRPREETASRVLRIQTTISQREF